MFIIIKNLCNGLKPLLIIYLIAQAMLRTGLAIYDAANINTSDFSTILKVSACGLLYDLAAFSYFLIPICLYLIPPAFKKEKTQAFADVIFLTIFFSTMLTTCIAEALFWEEFNARFNFIAVDYLVYTQEVIGNIKESYPVKTIFFLIGAFSFCFSYLFIKSGFKLKPSPHLLPANAFSHRLATLGLTLLLAIISFFTVSSNIADNIGNRYLNELAKNGYYSLFSAFRNNELNYEKFYITEKEGAALNRLRSHVEDAPDIYISGNGLHRHITGTTHPNKYNVILVIVESLSASFLESYGNKEHLTPNLDQLITQSISFSNMRAIGTRTVYGLAAINLSIPPTPGNAIVKRPENENLFSLATVFNSKGYESKFIYGGFGYFDNMNYFFANNGYQVVDRTSMDKAEISFANIWGVCDEDLFMKAIKEADKTHASGKPFLQVIMTTSNHRPYTYPNGKIDIPSHTGRNGGVKYTDYAVGALIKEAEKHDWFKDTIFVITADHTASSAGKIELSPEKYHIPFILYAPKIVKHSKVIDTLSSQIDIPPTLLGLLGFSYESKFFGLDLFKSLPERAFISNYQKLGYLTQSGLTIIKPIKEASYYKIDGTNFTLDQELNKEHLLDAISYFQNAANWRKMNKE